MSNYCSGVATVNSCVCEGSDRGFIIFSIYIATLLLLIDTIMHHSFADIKAWATDNMLKCSDNKKEFMLVTSKRTNYS